MSDFKFDLDIPLMVSKSEMFNGLIHNGYTNIPQAAPLVITKIHTEVDETVVSFGRGTPLEWVTLKIDYIDPVHFTYKCTIFKGDHVVMNNFKSISYDIKFIDSPNCQDGGSIYKSIYKCCTTFTTRYGSPVNEIVIQADKAYQTLIVKAVEAYLYANSNH
ncbi:major pollen allergen Cor a 1 isoforms 5, 6, 11 and 16-like [Actinidia eriantha]|uniref:major pollen allergen Cor a 1 isoforms 5, 6, 11 and 16-like n=1 Tax=Actinidia eriantha TaxID=165200 RepID=UPI002585ACD1|nr:major pollen allergen Cor a 1 isoforms 5, 6, 11 and 16-like [Actinidia eriantha]